MMVYLVMSTMVSLNVIVAKPPINEAENVIARNNINVKNLFLNM